MSVREIFDEISLSVISFLENHAGVSKVQFFERKPAATSGITEWEKQNFPCVLPEDFKAFLAISDGLLLRWTMQYKEQQVPLGCMQLNPISQVKQFYVGTSSEDGTEQPRSDFGEGEKEFKAMAFDIDSTCMDGRVALFYRTGFTDPQVWFQDLSCEWFFIANTFTDYFRLMIMHLGLPHWQYAFTDVGLDAISKQWFRFLSPERLAIDIENNKVRSRRGSARPGSEDDEGVPVPKVDLSKVHKQVVKSNALRQKLWKKSSKDKTSGSGKAAGAEKGTGRQRPTSAPLSRHLAAAQAAAAGSSNSGAGEGRSVGSQKQQRPTSASHRGDTTTRSST